MSRIGQVVVFLIIAAIAGGAAFLATWDIPPPSQQIEKVIPNDRFPR